MRRERGRRASDGVFLFSSVPLVEKTRCSGKGFDFWLFDMSSSFSRVGDPRHSHEWERIKEEQAHRRGPWLGKDEQPHKEGSAGRSESRWCKSLVATARRHHGWRRRENF